MSREPTAQSEQPVLSVKDVVKAIGGKRIIKGISFEIGAGEIFGFLGPNGSGKTTTIRMLVDLIRPTSGEIRVCGRNVRTEHDEALRQIGAIVENPEMYPFFTGWENLEHFARMLPDVGPERLREVVDIVGLDRRIHDKVKTYSLGMRQRLGIAQALLGRPKLLILDEPTNGLDPQGIRELRAFIRRLADDGMSLFISSHLLHEVQLMCDRVAIISHGEVIAVGRVDELLARSSGIALWHVDDGEAARRLLTDRGIRIASEDVIALMDVPAAPGTVIVAAEMEAEAIPDAGKALAVAGVRVYSAHMKRPSLEELFLGLTEGERID